MLSHQVRLMKEKEIFDVRALSKEAFAESLGLATVPDLGADWEAPCPSLPQYVCI